MKKSAETSKEAKSYYHSLSQLEKKSSEDFDDFMMTQTPQTPEELRQYMDFLKVHYHIHLDSSVMNYSRILIRDMNEKYPKNRDIRMAKRTFRSMARKKRLFYIGYALLVIAILAGYLWFENKHPKLFVFDSILHNIVYFFTRLLHLIVHLFI